jgi:hypothetical protein
MNILTTRLITVLTALALTAAPTMAASTIKFVSVPIPAGTAINNPNSSPGSGTLDGFHSYDLIVNTTTDWANAVILITLNSGQIYQEGEGFGGNGVTLGRPDPAGFGVLPSSEFDTYIFDPHPNKGSIAGGAHDVGGDSFQFDTEEIDVSWYSIGIDSADIGRFGIGRFTWSGDTNGTIALAYSTVDTQLIYSDYQIINGVIPEPATLNLLIIGGLGLIKRLYRV